MEKLGLSITLPWKSLLYQLQKNGKRKKIKKYILINLQNKGKSSPKFKHTSHIRQFNIFYSFTNRINK